MHHITPLCKNSFHHTAAALLATDTCTGVVMRDPLREIREKQRSWEKLARTLIGTFRFRALSFRQTALAVLSRGRYHGFNESRHFERHGESSSCTRSCEGRDMAPPAIGFPEPVIVNSVGANVPHDTQPVARLRIRRPTHPCAGTHRYRVFCGQVLAGVGAGRAKLLLSRIPGANAAPIPAAP